MESLCEFKNKLESKIKKCEQVFIVPHIGADLDAIASSIAMSYIVRKLGKEAYIILDEEPTKIEPGVRMIIEEAANNISIISLDKYRRMSSENDLLIACDVNKSYLVCCKNELDKFSDKVIIDHHNEDASTIDTDTKLILPEKSSASEIMYELLKKFQIKPDCFLANYLLAGIYLDTNKFTKNAECDTMKTVFALTSRGANVGKVNKYFEEDFYSDRRVQDLISKSEFYSYTVALCVGDAKMRYLKEELAKAADYLLRYRNVDASFAVGYTDENVISVSARSKGNINVGEIMSVLQGGGHATSAATRLEGSNLEETVKTLKKIYKPKFSIENE